ncbi:STT3 domain-containing protein, partial [Pseudodesulfovibrio sp.]|uniref:STT3 domain-containing protein n=1 Tax=Pseudodesulfovibrio sp. TaxID=2035812 RepID=UPI002623397E
GCAHRDWRSLVARGVAVDGVPMVTNNDGYSPLSEARRIVREGGHPSEFFVSLHRSLLLPALLAAVGGEGDLDLLSVSIWVGPVLGMTMVLAVLPWAWRTRSRLMVFAAPLLAYLAPAWMIRTHLGSLDTDALVPCALYFALFALERFTAGERGRARWLAGWAAMIVLLWLWWKPGVFLCLSLVPLSFAYAPRLREGVLLKIGVLALVAAALLLGLAGVTPFAAGWEYVREHLRLAFGLGGDTLVRHAIIELKGLTLARLGVKCLGAWPLLPVTLVGVVLYGRDRRWDGLFLIAFGLGGGVAGLVSNRFASLFIPAAAFFTAYGLIRGGELALDALGRRWNAGDARLRGVAGVLAVAVLLGPSALKAADYTPNAYFTGDDYALSRTIKASFPAGTTVWTWWDFGYFFEFFSGMRPFFDGGSQTDRSCFVAAYPLMQGDLARAAAWMRHFSRHSINALPAGPKGDAWEGAVAKLVDVDADRGTPVALCLPARVFATIGYLYSFAHVYDATVPPVVNRLDLFTREGFRFDPATGVLEAPQAMLDKGYTGFGAVVDATGRTPGQIDFDAMPDPYLVHSARAGFLAVTDRPVVRSVLFRLLGLFERDGAAFETLRFDWRKGGVWRVR